ncbi:hypothetical protein GCM10011365_01530 [Marinicella pacifica]|uniref:DUF4279 domain-containing protein n=1 Tax=Marinicella pacifica TaxID=1171543 RepID=A0A917CD20_9GAMM|nr:DUF4279 domain-containing protein [Marinicella pacifica]GGF84288.1 hypothetical protein GCM10011365_01530 [Marinicella pacifica]
MYEKLTYSGTECNNYLYLSFDGDVFDTEIISTELDIQPTSVMIKKSPVPKSTSWKYKIEAGSDINLEIYLNQLVDIFEPKIETINRLKKTLNLETHLQFVIYIDINPDFSTPYFGLNKRTINFLSMTETEVSFDLYKADTIGVFID